MKCYSDYQKLLILFFSALIIVLAGLFLMPSHHQPPLESNDFSNAILPFNVLDLYLLMAVEDLVALYERSPLDNERLPAYVKQSIDGPLIETEGVRFRGDSTRYLPKKSFNLSFIHPQPFIFNSHRMNLNASYTDPTQLRSVLSYYLHSNVGILTPRTQFFNLFINDIYEGLYYHVERIDENMIKANKMNPLGTLIRDEFERNQSHEDINNSSMFGSFLLNKPDYLDLLQQAIDYRSQPDWQKVVELIDFVENTPSGDAFYEKFTDFFDLDLFNTYLSILFITGDVDSFSNDYWLYLDHQDPNARWIIIPWDKDLTFGSSWRADHYVDNDFFHYEYDLVGNHHRNNLLIKKFFESDLLVASFVNKLNVIMTDVYPEEFFYHFIHNTAHKLKPYVVIEPDEQHFVLHPQNHHSELSDYSAHTTSLVDFIDLRYQFLRRHFNLNEHHPNDNINYATLDLSKEKGIQKGERLFFTDLNGFTIGYFDVEEILNVESLSLKAVPHDENYAISHLYLLEVEGSNPSITGELTLFYRNDVAHFSPENWYHLDEPIGRQWDLKIQTKKDGIVQVLESINNPYSNKVTATIHLNQSTTFFIDY